MPSRSLWRQYDVIRNVLTTVMARAKFYSNHQRMIAENLCTRQFFYPNCIMNLLLQFGWKRKENYVKSRLRGEIHLFGRWHFHQGNLEQIPNLRIIKCNIHSHYLDGKIWNFGQREIPGVNLYKCQVEVQQNEFHANIQFEEYTLVQIYICSHISLIIIKHTTALSWYKENVLVIVSVINKDTDYNLYWLYTEIWSKRCL